MCADTASCGPNRISRTEQQYGIPGSSLHVAVLHQQENVAAHTTGSFVLATGQEYDPADDAEA